MASDIRIEAQTDGTVSKGDVYSALRQIGADQLSESSPVSTQVREAFVAVGSGGITVKVEGHDGEWSQESQETLTRLLAGLDGVEAATIEVTGGHDGGEAESGAESGAEEDESGDDAEGADDDEADDDAQEGDEEGSEDVETINGVGPQTAETLRAAGIETADDVIDVGADGLVDAGVSEGRAENIVAAADFS